MQENDEHGEAQPGSDPESGSTGLDTSMPGNDPGPDPSLGGDSAWDGHQDTSNLLSYQVFPEGEAFFRQRGARPTQWAVAWSDLMMTMFIFFVVLFAYQAAHQEFLSREWPFSDIGPGTAPGFTGLGESTLAVEEAIPQIYDLRRLVETDEASTLRDFASVELAPDRTVRIILASDFLFDLGQAEIKPREREKLARIAKFIRRSPNMVNIIGHTDNIPMHSNRFATNWELSVSRATAVARFLIEEMKLPGKRFYVTGYAQYQPLVPNSTASNRAANRRVEIVITRDVPKAEPGTVGDVL
jgi:chemotaxis protein MotB